LSPEKDDDSTTAEKKEHQRRETKKNSKEKEATRLKFQERSASSSSPSASPSSRVLRSVGIGHVSVRVVAGNIADVRVDAVVNAANSLSFMTMDGGVSGALRNAMRPPGWRERKRELRKARAHGTTAGSGGRVIRKTPAAGKNKSAPAPAEKDDDGVIAYPKLFWDDDGKEHTNKRLPTTQAGVQPALGILRSQGVRHVVHAVGPIWTDYPVREKTFKIIIPQIKTTVRRALNAAARVGATSCAIPAISGGIFTHWKPNSNIKEREMKAARLAVVTEVCAWARDHGEATANKLLSVDIIDLPSRQRGSVKWFVEAFDKVAGSARKSNPRPTASEC